MILAIETSCDETAVCLLDERLYFTPGVESREFIIAEKISSQIDLHKRYGGVVPELASREHLKTLPHLVRSALLEADISFDRVKRMAVTAGPGLKGCLLVGVNYARALGLKLGVEVIPINHLEGHLYASHICPKEDRPKGSSLVLLVSGGHTSIYRWDKPNQYKLLTNTRDDSAGEAFDKSASLLQLPYPGGPELSKAAQKVSSAKYSFPIGMPDDDSSFSFSGFKTAVLKEVTKLSSISDEVSEIAWSVEDAVCRALTDKLKRAIKNNSNISNLVLTGGVAANQKLRKQIEQISDAEGLELYVPNKKWCTDNASMIAVCCAETYKGDLNYDFQVRPRWLLGAQSK